MRVGLLAFCALAAACNPVGVLDGERSSMAGAGVLVSRPEAAFDETMLSRLVLASVPATIADPKPFEDGAALLPAGTLVRTVGWFGTLPYTGKDDRRTRQNALRDARNQVQGALIAVSNNRCGAFKQMLRARSTNTAWGLGSLGLVLGAAGAIVTGGASQALSAAAGAAVGVGAEYEKDFMSGMTSAVIIPGIDKQRTALQQEIVNRQCYGVGSYNLSNAIADALRYHAACATDVGVAAAGSALSQSRTTPLSEAAETVEKVQALAALLQGKKDGPDPKADGKKGVLIGEAVNVLQCGPLDEDGQLPVSTTSLGRQRGRSRALFSGQVPTGVIPSVPTE